MITVNGVPCQTQGNGGASIGCNSAAPYYEDICGVPPGYYYGGYWEAGGGVDWCANAGCFVSENGLDGFVPAFASEGCPYVGTYGICTDYGSGSVTVSH